VRVDGGDEGRQRLSVIDIMVPDLGQRSTGPVELYIPESRINPPLMESLRQVLANHPGPIEVHLTVVMPDRQVSMRTDGSLRVTPSPALFGDLKALLGPTCLESPAARSA